jgi:hypothetical protein
VNNERLFFFCNKESISDVYGILSEHKIKLCNENDRNKFVLLYHFRKDHHISDQYSTRLVQAMMDNIGKHIPIIKPGETILR